MVSEWLWLGEGCGQWERKKESLKLVNIFNEKLSMEALLVVCKQQKGLLVCGRG